jgi:predicted DNA-binding transcriptional regulator AlpA
MKFTITEFDEINELIALVKELKNMLSNTTSKKWLTVHELSEYISYSKDAIYKMIGIQFIENYHFYKQSGKILFEAEKIDQWIRSPKIKPANHVEIESKINDMLKSIKCS